VLQEIGEFQPVQGAADCAKTSAGALPESARNAFVPINSRVVLAGEVRSVNRDMERAIKYPEHAETALYRTGSLNDPPILWERCVNRTKGSTRARRIFRTVVQIH
jgi:hypothetical protein